MLQTKLDSCTFFKISCEIRNLVHPSHTTLSVSSIVCVWTPIVVCVAGWLLDMCVWGRMVQPLSKLVVEYFVAAQNLTYDIELIWKVTHCLLTYLDMYRVWEWFDTNLIDIGAIHNDLEPCSRYENANWCLLLNYHVNQSIWIIF